MTADAVVQQRLGAHTIERRPVPEQVPVLDVRCCWHCHNSENMMHTLECSKCGFEVKGPVVQDHPTCKHCGGTMACSRYTKRYIKPLETVRKECYHPETGEQERPAALRAEGFK